MSKKRRDAHLPYDITNVGGNKVEILLYEQIGNSFWEEGITAKQFAKDLAAEGKVRQITLRINSPGGSVFDGLAIYNTLQQHPATVDVYIDGMAFSIASVIAMAGDTVSMAKNALMMVHNPRGGVTGTPEEIAAYAELMRKVRDSIVMAYANKTGKPDQELLTLVNAETYLTADEAVEAGFADEVTEELAVAASVDPSRLFTVPENVKARIESFSTRLPLEDTMSQEVTTPARVPATIVELEAMAGGDPAFVVVQLKAGATIDEARAVLCQQLAARVDAADKRIADLQSSLAAATTAQTPIVATATPTVVSHGTSPLTSSSASDGVVATKHPWAESPWAFYRAEFAKRKASGMSDVEAMKACSREFPELFEQLSQ